MHQFRYSRAACGHARIIRYNKEAEKLVKTFSHKLFRDVFSTSVVGGEKVNSRLAQAISNMGITNMAFHKFEQKKKLSHYIIFSYSLNTKE